MLQVAVVVRGIIMLEHHLLVQEEVVLVAMEVLVVL